MISFFSLCCIQILLSVILFPLIAATLILEWVSRGKNISTECFLALFRTKTSATELSSTDIQRLREEKNNDNNRLKVFLNMPFFQNLLNPLCIIEDKRFMSFDVLRAEQTVITKLQKQIPTDETCIQKMNKIIEINNTFQKRYPCFPFFELCSVQSTIRGICNTLIISILAFVFCIAIYYFNPCSIIPLDYSLTCLSKNKLLLYSFLLFISICAFTFGQMRPVFYDQICNQRGSIFSLLVKILKGIAKFSGNLLCALDEAAGANALFSLCILLLFVGVGILFFHNLPAIAKWTGKIFLLIFLTQCLFNAIRNFLLPHAKRICPKKQIMINILLALGAFVGLFSVIYATTVLLRPHPSDSLFFYVDYYLKIQLSHTKSF